MWAGVKRPTWEEKSHESSFVVPINPSKIDQPDYLQKASAIPVMQEMDTLLTPQSSGS